MKCTHAPERERERENTDVPRMKGTVKHCYRIQNATHTHTGRQAGRL